jgi:hypothetical protein
MYFFSTWLLLYYEKTECYKLVDSKQNLR